MTRKQGRTIIALMWMLLIVLMFLAAATKGSFGATISTRRHRQRKVRVVVDDMYSRFLYAHGDLIASYIDRTHDEDDTVVVFENAQKLFDVEAVTLCGGDFTEHRFKGLIGKPVMIAFDPQISSTANKCHELVGILPIQAGQ